MVQNCGTKRCRYKSLSLSGHYNRELSLYCLRNWLIWRLHTVYLRYKRIKIDQSKWEDRNFKDLHSITFRQGNIFLRSRLWQIKDNRVDFLFLQNYQWRPWVSIKIRFQSSKTIIACPIIVQVLHFGIYSPYTYKRKNKNGI